MRGGRYGLELIALKLEANLEALAKSTGRSKAAVAQEAIAQQLDDLEDYYEAAKAAKNPGRIHTSKKVEREVGL